MNFHFILKNRRGLRNFKKSVTHCHISIVPFVYKGSRQKNMSEVCHRFRKMCHKFEKCVTDWKLQIWSFFLFFLSHLEHWPKNKKTFEASLCFRKKNSFKQNQKQKGTKHFVFLFQVEHWKRFIHYFLFHLKKTHTQFFGIFFLGELKNGSALSNQKKKTVGVFFRETKTKWLNTLRFSFLFQKVIDSFLTLFWTS